MEQLRLPMLTVYTGPRLVDPELIDACRSYRQAVRACWLLRSRPALTQRQLGIEAGLYASHVSEYVSDDDRKRELPAKHVNDFELSCGNRFVSQWLARQSNLTILEQFMQPARLAA